MRTSILIAFLIISGFHNSVEAQSPLPPLKANPSKSEITLYSDPDIMIGALLLLKDSSILVSNSLIKEDYMSGNYKLDELYIDDINLITIKRRDGAVKGAFLGAIVGAGLSAIVTRILNGPPPYPNDCWGPCADDTYMFMVPFGAAVGAVTGGIIGGIKIKIPLDGSMGKYNLNKKKLGRYTVKYPGSPEY